MTDRWQKSWQIKSSGTLADHGHIDIIDCWLSLRKHKNKKKLDRQIKSRNLDFSETPQIFFLKKKKKRNSYNDRNLDFSETQKFFRKNKSEVTMTETLTLWLAFSRFRTEKKWVKCDILRVTATAGIYFNTFIHYSLLFPFAHPFSTGSYLSSHLPHCLTPHSIPPHPHSSTINHHVPAQQGVQFDPSSFKDRPHSSKSIERFWQEVETGAQIFANDFYQYDHNILSSFHAWFPLPIMSSATTVTSLALQGAPKSLVRNWRSVIQCTGDNQTKDTILHFTRAHHWNG
jgi:hypothetical protein